MPRGGRRQRRQGSRNRSGTSSPFTNISAEDATTVQSRRRKKSKSKKRQNKRSCFPLSIRRRMKPRCNESLSEGEERRLAHSPIQNSLEHNIWANNSQGIRIAMDLKEQGIISEKELRDIVQGDKRFYTHNPTTLFQSGAENDNHCPISLQPLKKGLGRTIAIVSPQNPNVFVRYDTLALADYLLASSADIDPIQRRKYTKEELQRIDSMVKLCTEATGSTPRKSVVEAVGDSKNKKEKDFQATALYGLDNLIGELIGEIFDLLEHGPGTTSSMEDGIGADQAQETYAHFLMYILPNFSYLFSQMMDSDVLYAQQSLEQYISRLKGPPNHPTADKYKVLPRILEPFKSKQLGKKALKEKRAEMQREREASAMLDEKRDRASSADSIMDVPV